MFGVVRLIILGLLVLLGFKLYRKFQQNKLKITQKMRSPATKKMTPCEHCGVYVPDDELVQAEGKFFCSEEHKEEYCK